MNFCDFTQKKNFKVPPANTSLIAFKDLRRWEFLDQSESFFSVLYQRWFCKIQKS